MKAIVETSEPDTPPMQPQTLPEPKTVTSNPGTPTYLVPPTIVPRPIPNPRIQGPVDAKPVSRPIHRPLGASQPPAMRPVADPVPATGLSLDLVLGLARDRNGQIRLAREKLQEAQAQHELNTSRWLPDILVGPSFYRHDGGIQDFQGNLLQSNFGSVFAGAEVRSKLDWREGQFRRLESERQVHQRRGDLTQVASDKLLDAATTYIDLLAARTAEVASWQMEKRLEELLDQATKLAEVDPGVRIEAIRVESELGAQRLFVRKFREGTRSAASKVLYLVGSDPTGEVAILDRQLTQIGLVDIQQPLQAMIEQAQRNGPGVQELHKMLTVIESTRAKVGGPGRYLPSLEIVAAEGGFGAGPGTNLNWANRFDLGMNFRWNLTDLRNAHHHQRLAESKVEQARLSYQDLRAKLTLGVQEAYETMHSSLEQMDIAGKQIHHAEETLRLSEERLKMNIKGRSPSEVLLAHRALFGARMSYLNALRDYDKAQVRLFVLLGAGCDTCRQEVPAPAASEYMLFDR
ncbi:MAG: TolC family protein [Gemmataceae bacterium]|nr:TolC family protein [Gemmataceae bacterium]